MERHSSDPPFGISGLTGTDRPKPVIGSLKQATAAKRGGTETELFPGEPDACVPALHGTENTMEDREIAALIRTFLRGLPAETRIIFLRQYRYGDSISAIAERFHCTQGTIKSSLFRTRNALRTYLEIHSKNESFGH